MKWRRRLYMLDGQRFDSSKVDAYLHRARIPLGKCTDCPDEIMPGQQYVKPNMFGSEDVLFHLECYGHAPPGVYLAVGTREGVELGVRRTVVIVRFFPAIEEIPYHFSKCEIPAPLEVMLHDDQAREWAFERIRASSSK